MGKQTPVVPKTTLRIKVRSRGGKGILKATVSLDSPARSADTDAAGFVKHSLSDAEITALSPAGQITIRVKKRHFGPDPGAGKKVVAGELKLTVGISKTGFDAGTKGLATDKSGDFLDVVLVDGGFNLGAATPGTIARRLTTAQVQSELIFLHHNGDLTLNDASEFTFTHDPAGGEFDPCDPLKCKINTPAANARIGVRDSTLGGIKYFALLQFFNSAAQKADVIPGQRFTRDTFGWGNLTVSTIDQRHAVGLTRLGKSLVANHGIKAIYTQGINGDTTRADCHGHGLALDLGGLAKTLPDPATKAKAPVRLGVDFIVFYHWGGVPMFDSTTVAQFPADPTKWKRLTVNDDGFNYTTDPTGATHKLHYRLDPAPFQDPIPAGTAPAVATAAAPVAPHFVTARALFQDIMTFVTAEFSDANSTLGPLTPPATDPAPTPIDSHSGHFILHPDYSTPNPPGAKSGRQAHVNHFHFQFGPTSFPAPRVT